MSNWETLITPAVVSVIVTAIIGPLVFYFLKRRDEKARRNFEVRFVEYKKYLSTLEEIAQASRGDFERDYMKTVTEVMNEIISNPGDSEASLMRLNTELESFASKIRESFTKATSELHGLRLVCSTKLLSLIDEFIQLQRDLMDLSISIMSKANSIDLSDPESMVSGEMKFKAGKYESLLDQIIKQMRKELGIQ